MKSLRCFVIGMFIFSMTLVQAQEVKVLSVEQVMKNMNPEGQADLNNLLNGAISKLILSNDNAPMYVWKEEGATKVVKIDEGSKLELLNDNDLTLPLATAEVFIFTWGKENAMSPTSEQLTRFKKLKYILINSYDELNETILRDILKDVLSFLGEAKVQVLFEKLEQPS